ncbi:sulfite exporter TauE/SafE family protein [Agriterribacter sp.]|uniref:sulfite exporter TauE/SafE family protein n=1 Tax=Agriterribacter sp. TaxID=2821509 RepID=UPI002BFBAAB9|nr:sulfite exporter TauE/SafE family protein [Agriterribacter sp.]HTN06787.1 sulfite exporter TauE/SafE family protein [Agriterribacter sp.]
MQFIGYIAAVLIGISLGLIGGGGSILTVPLLVYIFHLPPAAAVSYSLFIVGITSLIGAFNNFRKKQASLNLALPLGIVSPATVFFVRRDVVPHIPEQLWIIGKLEVTKSTLTMLLFAVLMLAAAVSMLKRATAPSTKAAGVRSMKDYFQLGLFGLGIGCVTGFLGAGGGFLIIPALVLLMKLPMKEAVGTSLFIIGINSLIGFTGDLGHYTIDWIFLWYITAIASAGILIGTQLAKKIPSEKLKRGFGWFVLVMGMYIIVQEVMILWG